LIDWNRGWQDTWANDRTYLGATWLPFFTGVTTHTRLLREWLLDGLGGLDLYLWHQLGPLGPWVVTLLLAAGLAAWWAAWVNSAASAVPAVVGRADAAQMEPPQQEPLSRRGDDAVDVAVT
jgi:hypothetical protein